MKSFPANCLSFRLIVGHRRGTGGHFFSLWSVGDERLGGENHCRDRRRILQGRTSHFGGIGDTGSEQVFVLFGHDVKADVRIVLLFLQAAHLADHNRAIFACVFGELAKGFLERAFQDLNAGFEVSGQGVLALTQTVERRSDVDECYTSAGYNALFNRRAGCRECIFHAVFLFFEFGFGCRAHADHGDAAGQLGQALLQFFAVIIARGLVALGFDLVDATLDVFFRAQTFDDGRVIFGRDDAPRLTRDR